MATRCLKIWLDHKSKYSVLPIGWDESQVNNSEVSSECASIQLSDIMQTCAPISVLLVLPVMFPKRHIHSTSCTILHQSLTFLLF